MPEEKISRERWQGMYGPVTQEFSALVSKTLKKTREAPAMKRFTLRTALVLLLCLLLLTGIALAAAGVFSTRNTLKMYTSAPTDAGEAEIQTDLAQIGGDFPDLTVAVRDAVFDGTTAYVTAECRLKDPGKNMILSMPDAEFWGTEGWGSTTVERWPGFSQRPLTDPVADPRRKLAIADDGAYVYDLYNGMSIAEYIYEADGVLVLTWRVRMDSDNCFEVTPRNENEFEVNDGLVVPVSATPSPESGFPSVIMDSMPMEIIGRTAAPEAVRQVLDRVAGPEPLDLRLALHVEEWLGTSQTDRKGYTKKLYDCGVAVTLKKPDKAPVVLSLQAPITQEDMTITDARFTFTSLATYVDIRSQYPLGLGTCPEMDNGQLSNGLGFEWLDSRGNVVKRLGVSSTGSEYVAIVGLLTPQERQIEMNHYTAFWPAMDPIPDTVTLRAYSEYTKETLATFTLPLGVGAEPSPAP